MASDTTQVRIVITPIGQGSEVYLNGQKLANVRSFTLGKVGIDTLTTLAIEFVNVEVEIAGSVKRVTQSVPTASGWWRRWWAWFWRGEIEVTHLQSVAREYRTP